jgi:hypothetical protein
MPPKIAKKYHERPGGHARELQQRRNRAFGAVVSCVTRKKGGNTEFPTLSHSIPPLQKLGEITSGVGKADIRIES